MSALAMQSIWLFRCSANSAYLNLIRIPGEPILIRMKYCAHLQHGLGVCLIPCQAQPFRNPHQLYG